MRMVVSVLGLLVVAAIIGLLAKKQLTAGAVPAVPATDAAVAVPAGTPKQQVEQVRQAVEAAMQAPRAMPDEAK